MESKPQDKRPKTDKPPKIFLAHASEDEEQVRQIYQKLKAAGLAPWMSEIDLIPGQNWQIEIPRATHTSEFFVACLSKRSVEKQGYVQKEFRLALNTYAEKPPGSIYLIPVRLDECEVPDLQIPESAVRLTDIQWLDLFKPDGFDRLLKAIELQSGWTCIEPGQDRAAITGPFAKEKESTELSSTVSYEDALKVKEKYKMDLMSIGTTTVTLETGQRMTRPNVVGVGVGRKLVRGKETEELSIAVSVIKKLPAMSLRKEEIIPREIEGIKTDVIETGVIRAPLTPVGMGRRIRPAKGGCSIGHYNISAGTFGCLVWKGNEEFILSNNHVLANENKGVTGDAILQPGSYDGGTFGDKIAELSTFVVISFDYGTNKVDAALARPVERRDVSSEITGIGSPRDTVKATLDIPVIKSGRTTGVTRERIRRTDYTVRVEYSGGRTALFENQLATWRMSEGGDSGSVVLVDDGTCRICGLLFAGSEYVTVINKIEDVLSALNASIEFPIYTKLE